MSYNWEADEVSIEDLESAAEYFDGLKKTLTPRVMKNKLEQNMKMMASIHGKRILKHDTEKDDWIQGDKGQFHRERTALLKEAFDHLKESIYSLNEYINFKA